MRTSGKIALCAGILCALIFASASFAQDIGSPAGVWQASVSGTHYDAATGVATKIRRNVIWTINTTDENSLVIEGLDGSERDFNGELRHGITFLGGESDIDLIYYTGYATPKGVPGRMQVQGEVLIMDGSAGPDALAIEALTFKAKQLTVFAAPDLSARRPKAGADDKAPEGTLDDMASDGSIVDLAPAAPVATPPISDIYDTYWTVKLSGKGYDFDTDEPMGSKTMYWHLTQGVEAGDIIVEMASTDSESDTVNMRYENGLLVYLDNDGNEPPASMSFGVVQISGKPGALKAKGIIIDYGITGVSDFIQSMKVSGKQMRITVPG